jgi:hypothetical protein
MSCRTNEAIFMLVDDLIQTKLCWLPTDFVSLRISADLICETHNLSLVVVTEG